MNSCIRVRHTLLHRHHMVRATQYVFVAAFTFHNPSSSLLVPKSTIVQAPSQPHSRRQPSKLRFTTSTGSINTGHGNETTPERSSTTMTSDCACCPKSSKFTPNSSTSPPPIICPESAAVCQMNGTSPAAVNIPTTAGRHLDRPQNQSPTTASATVTTSTTTASTTTTTTTTTTVPKNTFYRRSLPNTCVAFSSKLGRTYFASSMRNRGLKSYFHLMEQYTTQSEPAFCGISTLVIALNALAVDPRQIWKGSWRWYEESMLNCCFDLEQAKITGITMQMFNCLALCQGLTMETHYVDESDKTDVTNSSNDDSSLVSVEKFRELVREACVETNPDSSEGDDQNDSHSDMSVDRVLIASYTRRTLQQTGSGHFSPIAAYDEESDTVLIMDTARFKYGAHWVKLPLIYEAMQPIDPDTGRSRGYMMLIHPKDDADTDDANKHHRLPNLPIAILLRSEMKQSQVRRSFKDYLVTLDKSPSYTDIASFFYRKGSYHSIWDMVLAQLRPYDNDIATKTIVEELRSLIGYVLSSVKTSKTENDDEQQVDDSSHCRANHCRTIQLRTEEAILIVYLSCLDVQERERIIFDPRFLQSTTEQARLQLLAEAELVRYAVDTSDQVPTNVINPTTSQQ